MKRYLYFQTAADALGRIWLVKSASALPGVEVGAGTQAKPHTGHHIEYTSPSPAPQWRRVSLIPSQLLEFRLVRMSGSRAILDGLLQALFLNRNSVFTTFIVGVFCFATLSAGCVLVIAIRRYGVTRLRHGLDSALTGTSRTLSD